MSRKYQKTVLYGCIFVFLVSNVIVSPITGNMKHNSYGLVFSSQEQIASESHTTVITMENTEIIQVNETLIIRNTGEESIDSIVLWNNHIMLDLSVREDENELISEEYNSSSAKIVYLNTELTFNTSRIIYLSYFLETSEYLVVVDDKPPYFHFSFDSMVFFSTYKYEITVRLPINSFIHDRSYPFASGGKVESPANRFQITWLYYNLMTWEGRAIYVYFDEPPGRITPVWVFIISPLSGLLIGCAATLWVVRRRKGKTIRKLGEVFLTDIQRKLLGIIIEKGGKITQKELVTLTEFSKSKVSRNLSPLEENGFITKQKWGNQYRVYITNLGRKVIE